MLNQPQTKQNAERLIIEASKLYKTDEKDFADSVLQVAMSQNETIFGQVKEVDGIMCEALRELMKPEMDAAIANAIANAVAEKDSALAVKDARIRELEALLAQATSK